MPIDKDEQPTYADDIAALNQLAKLLQSFGSAEKTTTAASDRQLLQMHDQLNRMISVLPPWGRFLVDYYRACILELHRRGLPAPTPAQPPPAS